MFVRRLCYFRSPEAGFGGIDAEPERPRLTVDDLAKTAAKYLDDQELKDYVRSNAEQLQDSLVAFAYTEAMNATNPEPFALRPILKEMITAHQEGRDQVQPLLETLPDAMADAWRAGWRRRVTDVRNKALPASEQITADSDRLDRALAESQQLELAAMQGENVDVERTFFVRKNIQDAAEKLAVDTNNTAARAQLAFLLMERLSGPGLRQVDCTNIEQSGQSLTLDITEKGEVVAGASVNLADGQLSVARILPGEDRLPSIAS